MASISITIEGITSQYVDPEPGELETQLGEVAGIIESAIENAFGTEAVEYTTLDVSIDAS